MRLPAIALLIWPAWAADRAPEHLLDSAALLAQPKELRLLPGRTSMVFRGEAGASGFNLHSYLARHDGRFYAMWSSAKVGEEDPDQFIRYAVSVDGHRWSPAASLMADPDGAEGPQRWIARGFFTHQGRLHALGALVGSADYGKRGTGVVWDGLRLLRSTWQDGHWTAPEAFAEDCMNNFAPALFGGLWQMPCRDRNMSLFLAVAVRVGPPWQRVSLDETPPFHRLDEPTLYGSDDGVLHMIIRDGARSGKLVRSISRDGGRSWSKPVHTDYPDATSKNFTGRLSDGRYYLINNPDPKSRDPLAISFSRDGWVYGSPAAIRQDAPERRVAGRAKGSRSLQYPHAIEHAGSLWVIYSTNKEDIEVTEIHLADLPRLR